MANDPSELRKEKVCKQVGDGLLDGSYLSPCDWRESWKEQWRVVVGGRRWGGRGCVWVGGGGVRGLGFCETCFFSAVEHFGMKV